MEAGRALEAQTFRSARFSRPPRRACPVYLPCWWRSAESNRAQSVCKTNPLTQSHPHNFRASQMRESCVGTTARSRTEPTWDTTKRRRPPTVDQFRLPAREYSRHARRQSSEYFPSGMFGAPERIRTFPALRPLPSQDSASTRLRHGSMSSTLVPKAGLGPARPEGHRGLRSARLPIPPPRHSV